MSHQNTLPIYVVYDHPKDYPDEYVCRIWIGETPEPELCLRSKSLSEIHQELAWRGLVRLEPKENDDKSIESTWL